MFVAGAASSPTDVFPPLTGRNANRVRGTARRNAGCGRGTARSGRIHSGRINSDHDCACNRLFGSNYVCIVL